MMIFRAGVLKEPPYVCPRLTLGLEVEHDLSDGFRGHHVEQYLKRWPIASNLRDLRATACVPLGESRSLPWSRRRECLQRPARSLEAFDFRKKRLCRTRGSRSLRCETRLRLYRLQICSRLALLQRSCPSARPPFTRSEPTVVFLAPGLTALNAGEPESAGGAPLRTGRSPGYRGQVGEPKVAGRAFEKQARFLAEYNFWANQFAGATHHRISTS